MVLLTNTTGYFFIIVSCQEITLERTILTSGGPKFSSYSKLVSLDYESFLKRSASFITGIFRHHFNPHFELNTVLEIYCKVNSSLSCAKQDSKSFWSPWPWDLYERIPVNLFETLLDSLRRLLTPWDALWNGKIMMKWRNVYDMKVITMTTIETISWSKIREKCLLGRNVT